MTQQLDGGALDEWAYEGFPDEAVLVVPFGGMLYEVGVRAMEEPDWTRPTEPPRAATLDEIAAVAWLMAQKAGGNETSAGTDTSAPRL